MVLLCLDEANTVYSKPTRCTAALGGYLKSLLATVDGRLRIVLACVHWDSPSDQHDVEATVLAAYTPWENKQAHLISLLPTSSDSQDSSSAAKAAFDAAKEAVNASTSRDIERVQQAHAALAAAAPGLVLCASEYDELWTRFWANHPHLALLFNCAQNLTKNDIFSRTAGQVGGGC